MCIRDSGKLTAVLAASGKYPKVIGADLRPGPLAKAEQTLEYAGCKEDVYKRQILPRFLHTGKTCPALPICFFVL